MSKSSISGFCWDWIRRIKELHNKQTRLIGKIFTAFFFTVNLAYNPSYSMHYTPTQLRLVYSLAVVFLFHGVQLTYNPSFFYALYTNTAQTSLLSRSCNCLAVWLISCLLFCKLNHWYPKYMYIHIHTYFIGFLRKAFLTPLQSIHK